MYGNNKFKRGNLNYFIIKDNERAAQHQLYSYYLYLKMEGIRKEK